MQLLPYPTRLGGDSGARAGAGAQVTEEMGTPSHVILTPFHVLLMYRHHLVGLNRLNFQVAFQEHLDEGSLGTMRTMLRDPATGAVWAMSNRALFQLVNVVDEDRDMWKLFLDRAQSGGDPDDFKTALRYAQVR